MATSVLFSTLSGVINTLIADEVIRTFNAQARLLAKLPKTPVLGQNATWDFEGTGAAVETFNDGDDVSNYSADDPYKAQLVLQGLRSNVRAGDQAVAAAKNAGPAALGAFWRRLSLNAMRKFASVVNQALYAGSGSFVGLAAAIADTGTYATIDRSTNANFRSLVVDPGSLTAPTIAQLRGDIATIYDNCGEVPPLAVCRTAEFNKIAGLFTEVRRINEAGRMDMTVDAIEIDGCILMKDKDCTANAIYYLNPNYLEVQYLPQDAVEGGFPIMASDGQSELNLGIRGYDLARVGAAARGTFQSFLQLVVRHPKAMGKRLNVNPA